MKTVCITGVTGQDGSYLAELALSKGYTVVGLVRDLGRSAALSPTLRGNVDLVKWDLLDSRVIEGILSAHQPELFFNFAAYSTGGGMYDDPVGIGEVNGLAVTRILEAMLAVAPTMRFCQASSREIFGEASETPQSETTSLCPRSPYGAAKMYADSMVRIYRERYKLFAASAILFNHESPRRSLAFLTRKITHTAARIKLGVSAELKLGNLDAQRDWGFAADYVEAMWLMLQQDQAEDFVIASGVSHSVRDVCQIAFEHLGLDYKTYLVDDSALFRPAEPFLLVGNAQKARDKLNWAPKVAFADMVRQMVEHDLQVVAEEKLRSH
jgi:GDPmannose 4,6-dehydratase